MALINDFFHRIYYLFFRNFKNRRRRILFLILVILGGSGLFYFSQTNRLEIYAKYHTPINFAKKISNVFYFWAYFIPSKLPVYDIEISEKDRQKLLASRPPIYQGVDWTPAYKKISVPAVFKYGGQTYEIEIKFRGLNDTHWRDPKKSYNIEFKNNGLFFDQKAIQLIIPDDKEYYAEPFSYYLAKKLGLETNSFKFINLKINGKNQGVYLEIKDWDNLSRAEGVGKTPEKDGSDLYTLLNLEKFSALNPNLEFAYLGFWKKYNSESGSNISDFANLKKFLALINNPSDEYFFQRIGEIVDLDNFYRWNALNLLYSNRHAGLSNTKLFFNSSLGKFQFITWDAYPGYLPDIGAEVDDGGFISRILSHPPFLRQRNKILADYLNNNANLTNDLAYFDELYNETKRDFYKDYNKIDSNFKYDQKIKILRNKIIDGYAAVKNFLKTVNIFIEADLNDKNITPFKIINVGFSSIIFDKLTVEFNENIDRDKIYLFRDFNGNNIFDDSDLWLTELNKTQEDKKIFQAENINALVFSRKEIFIDQNGKSQLRIAPYASTFFLKSGPGGLKEIKDIKFVIINELTNEKVPVKDNIRFVGF